MKNLFNPEDLAALNARIALLRPNSERQWGKMSAAQALAHCSLGMQTATGELHPPRMLIGRILGPLIKPKVVRMTSPCAATRPPSQNSSSRTTRT